MAATDRSPRLGLLVDLQIALGNESERAAALDLLENRVEGPATVAGARGYDVRSFVEGCRTLGITPHVAQSCLSNLSRFKLKVLWSKNPRLRVDPRRRLSQPAF